MSVMPVTIVTRSDELSSLVLAESRFLLLNCVIAEDVEKSLRFVGEISQRKERFLAMLR